VDVTAQPDHRGQRVPPSLDAIVRKGLLDAETAALLSLLVEGRVPILVAGTGRTAERAAVLDALLTALPPDARRIEIAGATEDFEWLPEATELGWRPDGPTPGREPLGPADPATGVLVLGDLASDDGGSTWGGVVRIAVRAISVGYGLAATIDADGLDAVIDRLRAAPFRLTDDEISRLGVVVVLGAADDGGPRIVATHYIRPVARDMHGHVQRLGPAVLGTYDEGSARFEHFGWGITPELALRVGRRPGDLELEQERRATELAAGGSA
jgi:type IV secretory pathway ATPase VirB11/archaellum biosynthesis ATPase